MNRNAKRVTRADVARAAGVSVTIVSYVMNNNRYVAGEKRQRVEEAIAALNYCPNNVARALKGMKSNQILFIVDEITSEYFSRIISRMDEYAYAAGYLISLCANRNTQEFVSQVISRQYDGIIISSTGFPLELVESFSKAGIPVLMFKHKEYGKLPEHVAVLSSGLYLGARRCIRHLVERGKRNIIFVDSIRKNGNKSGPDDLRLSGFMDELKAQGLEWKENIVAGCRSEEELIHAVSTRLEKGTKVDGILGRNDMVACIAMDAALGLGYKVPGDIGVVGFDNSSLSRFCFPRLTTMEMEKDEISRRAIEMIREMIGGRVPEDVEFETKLIKREST